VLSSVMFIVMLAIAFDIAFLLFRKFAISKGIRQ
jgi:hypothetical protein